MRVSIGGASAGASDQDFVFAAFEQSIALALLGRPVESSHRPQGSPSKSREWLAAAVKGAEIAFRGTPPMVRAL